MKLPGWDDPDDTDGSGGEQERSTWSLVDLEDALAGRKPQAPTLMRRVDGKALIYPGRIHWFQGESESLKSWAAQFAVAQALIAGLMVLYIDFEDEVVSVVDRLVNLGVPADALRERFHYVNPEEALIHRGKATPGHVVLGQLLETNQYDLAIIDGVTEAMVIEDLDLMSNADAAAWMRRLPKRLSRLGIAVICIDHVVKNADARGRFAIGAQHKLAGVDGAVYSFSVKVPLARAIKDPVVGQVLITVQKDRPGWVRSACRDGHVGVLEITSWPDDRMDAIITTEPTIPPPPLELVGRIMDYLGVYDGASKNRLETDVDGKAEMIRAALAWLIEQQWIRVEQKGQAHRHYITSKGAKEWAA